MRKIEMTFQGNTARQVESLWQKNNRNPQKKKEQIFVAVTGVVLVISNLLHGAAWGDDQGFQLDLYHQRQTRHRSGDMGDKKRVTKITLLKLC